MHCHRLKSEASTQGTSSKAFSQENNFFSTLPLILPFTWNEIQFKEVCQDTESRLALLVALFCLRVSWLLHLPIQHNTNIQSSTCWKIWDSIQGLTIQQVLKGETFILKLGHIDNLDWFQSEATTDWLCDLKNFLIPFLSVCVCMCVCVCVCVCACSVTQSCPTLRFHRR